MPTNITYLLGAGASCNVLPMVKDMPNRLSNFSQQFDYESNKPELDEFPNNYPYNIKEPFSQVVRQFKEDVNWLKKEAMGHSSIDTLARKYYLSDKKFELKKLKILLNEFFTVEQLLKGIDIRYDSFFASILKGERGNIEIPSNIKILNWNYDKQLEFSFGQFSSDLDPNNDNHGLIIEKKLQIFPRNSETKANKDRFSIVKLNGTFGGSLDDYENYSQLRYNVYVQKELSDKQRLDILTLSLGRYYTGLKNAKTSGLYLNSDPTIFYAWENNVHVKELREKATDLVTESEILVVIGYSFPTFNRSIDKDILKSMKGLKTVYIQNTPDSIEGVMQRFKSISEFKGSVNPITSVDEFFIPYEFS